MVGRCVAFGAGGQAALKLALDEVVERAPESDFPSDLYQALLEQLAKRDRALVSMGLATHIIESRAAALRRAESDPDAPDSELLALLRQPQDF